MLKGLVAHDPCWLVRQVKEVGKLRGRAAIFFDPCRLVRQVKQVGKLERGPLLPFSSVFDPCRLVRQVKEVIS